MTNDIIAMTDSLIKNARILIIDDEADNAQCLELMLRQEGYVNIITATDSRDVFTLFILNSPDIILLDLHMPHLDGFEVLAQLCDQMDKGAYLPILVLTADPSPEAKREALANGASDFLARPLDAREVLLKMRNFLQIRFQNHILEAQICERTWALKTAQVETLERLAMAVEYRDDDTGFHTRRVGLSSARIAECIGMKRQDVCLIEQTAPLHDIGKIGIADTILLKPGKLTQRMYAAMKNHTVIGGKLLSGSGSPWLQKAEEIALTHHERWDGTGYPAGMAGDTIPIVGRIVAVADVFDALTHNRPYKPAWSIEQALDEIKHQSGRQFDPAVVEAFMTLPHQTLV